MLAASLVAVALSLAPASAADPGLEKGTCAFDNEPVFPGYYWDPSCKLGKTGCNADNVSVHCRFCGGGVYDVPCPPSACHFHGSPPSAPYYWDEDCKLGMLGCWADGIHGQCRFCGMWPYTSIPCPEKFARPPAGPACTFAEEVTTPHFWDPSCTNGTHGCLADGIHAECRYCGAGDYVDIECPASKICKFALEPTVPYFWDPTCAMGKLGCNADGLHVQCRYCMQRPFESVSCPEAVAPRKDICTFPKRGEPLIPYYWEPECTEGMLGCWADAIHPQCRFCGVGVFANITCPSTPGQPDAPGGGVLPDPAEAAPGRSLGAELEDIDVARSTPLRPCMLVFGAAIVLAKL